MLGNAASRRIFWAAIIMGLVSTVAAVATVVNGWFDFVEIAAPSNPSANRDRLYANSSSHQLACLTSSGTSCFPSSGGSGVNVSSGTYASLPGTCGHSSTQSDIYYATDSLYSQFLCTATNTWTPMIGSYLATMPPAVGTLTGFNVGSITTNTTAGGLELVGATSDSSTWRGYYKASTLTTRFTVVLGMSIDSGTDTSYAGGRCGILLHQSSGDEMAYEVDINAGGTFLLGASEINSSGGGVVNNFSNRGPFIGFQGLAWISVRKSGTTYIMQGSFNGGKNWQTLGTFTMTNFDGYGIFVKNENSVATHCQILDWEAT